MTLSYKIQASFTSGEVSPRLLGRTDLATYERAAKEITNAYAFTHGGVTRRKGSHYVSEIHDSTEKARLIPFVYSDDDSYLLIFNGGRIEFVKDGDFIEVAAVPYFISMPYTEDELAELTYSQSGNIIFFAHPNHPPKQLQRITDTNWTLTDLPFDYNAVSDFRFDNGYIGFKIVTAGDGFSVGHYFTIVTDGVGGYVQGGPFQGTGPVLGGTEGILAAVSVNEISTAETWTITCVSDGEGREEWSVVGSVSGTPPCQWGPSDYPKAVSFYEQRLYFAGSNTYPQRIWGSVAGDFLNFTLGPSDGDGIEFTIASNRFDKIQHLVGTRQLLPLTVASEFSMEGGQGTTVTPSSVKIRAHTFHGSSNVRPLQVGQETIFVQRDGKKLRAVSFDITLDANVAPDITILAEHITRPTADSEGIIDGTFAQDPDFVMWFVRDDGVLLSCTHMREQEVTAWATHTTEGLYKNVTALPTGDTDTVYLIVERVIDGTTRKYLEYFEGDTYLDCDVHGYSGSPQDVWSGLDHLEGETIQVIADGRTHPDVTVSGGSVTLQRPVETAVFGYGYTSTIQLLHPEIPLGDGTSQGRELTIKSVVLRLQDTVGLSVNGIELPAIFLPEDLDAAPTPYTGDRQIEQLGWNTPNEVLITQDIAMPFTLLAVVTKAEVND